MQHKLRFSQKCAMLFDILCRDVILYLVTN